MSLLPRTSVEPIFNETSATDEQKELWKKVQENQKDQKRYDAEVEAERRMGC